MKRTFAKILIQPHYSMANLLKFFISYFHKDQEYIY